MGGCPPSRRRVLAVALYRTAALAAVVAYFVNKTFGKQVGEYLWPHGYADRNSLAPTLERRYVGDKNNAVDLTNDGLQVKHGKTKFIRPWRRLDEPPLWKGVECIFFDREGIMYGFNERAQLIRLTDFRKDYSNTSRRRRRGGGGGNDEHHYDVNVTAEAGVVKGFDRRFGRPLCGKFITHHEEEGSTGEETLYIADAVLGLTRIKNPFDPKSKLELVASTAAINNFRYGESPIYFANGLSIGHKTGRVYFTDTTNVAPARRLVGSGGSSSGGASWWDLMYAGTIELIRGKPTGRLLRYDPKNDITVDLLYLSSSRRSFHFANGVAVDPIDEEYVLIAETATPRVYKHHLTKGLKLEGKTEVLLDSKDLPGYIDNIECSRSNHLCYAAVAGAVAPIQKLFDALPSFLEVAVRNVLLMLPRSMLVDYDEQPSSYASVVEFDPVSGKITRLIQDPTGKDVSGAINGATPLLRGDGKLCLYLSSLAKDYVVEYQL